MIDLHKLKNNAIVNMLCAALCLAIMGSIVAILGKKFSSIQLSFVRSSVGCLVLLSTFLFKPIRQRGGKIKLLITRGVLGTFSLYAFYYCLTKLHLAVANTYYLTYPIFISIISFLFFKEKIKGKQIMAVGLGFVGILLVFNPSLNINYKFHIIGLISGVLAASGYIAINKLSNYYDRRIIVLSFLITSSTVSFFLLWISTKYYNAQLDFILGKYMAPTPYEWFLLLLMGLIALLAQTFLTRAYSFGKPNEVGLYNFMQIPFAVAISFFMQNKNIDAQTICGIVLIILSGIVIIRE